MIHIIYDSGEFNITNLESLIYLKNITDLKWFVKNVVKIANNKAYISAMNRKISNCVFLGCFFSIIERNGALPVAEKAA